ncbi:hypothetical protein Tco_0814437 [Tanacetum coccineum]
MTNLMTMMSLRILFFLSDEDPGIRLDSRSHKKNQEEIDDDKDKNDDANNDKNDDDDDHNDHALIRNNRMGISEIRTEKIRQGYMMQQMKKTFMTNNYLSNILKNIYGNLKEIIPKLATSTTNDLMKDNLPWIVEDAVKKEREQYKVEIPACISQEFAAHAPKIIEELFRTYMQNTVLNVHPNSSTSTASIHDSQQQIYLRMKSDLQSQFADPELDAFRKGDHEDHPSDDAPHEEEKSAKRQKTSKESKSTRGSSSKQPVQGTNNTSSEQPQQQDYDAWRIPSIFDRKRIEATMKDMMNNQLRNTEEYAYHLEQAKNYLENQIVWESNQEDLKIPGKEALIHATPFPEAKLTRQERANPKEVNLNHKTIEVIRITAEKKHGLDFMDETIVKRDDNKFYGFYEAVFKYLNMDDIEDMYYVTPPKSGRSGMVTMGCYFIVHTHKSQKTTSKETFNKMSHSI